ncbi:hypothetical protein [Flavobacterium hercynium]|uniref:Uncharacterized protein n=1 Tax=Flavobacterium hercynium TaxID=387094 RepID=A0A226H0W1_9FLAO|nr:hypothetical protein [Flavobacterium hercynium]OXA87301.1 hypothetical protein B0A66_16960 [Flavobacterium hercynium]SMP19798.1 hypothetical protein SAMN06265346_10676 [Flavobacterium hercynium]
MKTILISVFALLLISCHDKKENQDNTSKINSDSTAIKNDTIKSEPVVDTIKHIEVGYWDQYEKMPKLNFDSISETEFESITPKKFLQAVKPEQKGNYFYLSGANKKHAFKKYNDYGGEESHSGYELLGRYTDSKLYAMIQNSTAENLGFGEFFLFDPVSEYHYNIVSFGDASVETPIPSVNNKYLVYYNNGVYENHNCDIGILKINDLSDPKHYLTEVASSRKEDFTTEKIVWKTDDCFYVKGYTKSIELKTGEKKYAYFKLDIN